MTRFTFDALPDTTTWDKRIADNPDGGEFLQTKLFAEVKQSTGWTPRYIFDDSVAIMALEKHIPLLGKYWYIPKGPGVTSAQALAKLLPQLAGLAKKAGVFTVTVEPEIIATDEAKSALKTTGLRPIGPIQPNNSTIIVDLSADEDALLASFSQSTRRMIRKAQKAGVQVKAMPFSDKTAHTMYDIYKQTAAGQFSLRDYDYYHQLWRSFSRAKKGQLFFAHIGNDIVAGAFIMYQNQKALYKDGASPRTKLAEGTGQFIQWEIMKYLKAQGITTYDLHGTPPAHAIDDKTHPKYRLGIFKRGFNKHVTDYVGAYDLIIAPTKYKLWTKIMSRLIQKLHRLRHHQSWW